MESRRRPYILGPLAQLVEQETLNLLVVGSIPTRPTTSALQQEGPVDSGSTPFNAMTPRGSLTVCYLNVRASDVLEAKGFRRNLAVGRPG
jgi:hypothetical protein